MYILKIPCPCWPRHLNLWVWNNLILIRILSIFVRHAYCIIVIYLIFPLLFVFLLIYIWHCELWATVFWGDGSKVFSGLMVIICEFSQGQFKDLNLPIILSALFCNLSYLTDMHTTLVIPCGWNHTTSFFSWYPIGCHSCKIPVGILLVLKFKINILEQESGDWLGSLFYFYKTVLESMHTFYKTCTTWQNTGMLKLS